jgi:hypothetical protein
VPPENKPLPQSRPAALVGLAPEVDRIARDRIQEVLAVRH